MNSDVPDIDPLGGQSPLNLAFNTFHHEQIDNFNAFKSQLWVTALTTWGALTFTVFAISMAATEMTMETGYGIVVGVAGFIWVSPIIGIVMSIVAWIRLCKTRERIPQDLQLESAFKILNFVQQLIFIGSLAGILWVIFLPPIKMDQESRILEYFFILTPYTVHILLCINSIFHFPFGGHCQGCFGVDTHELLGHEYLDPPSTIGPPAISIQESNTGHETSSHVNLSIDIENVDLI